MLHIQDRTHLYAIVASVALHGAIAVAIVFQIANSMGAPARDGRKATMMTVFLATPDSQAQPAAPAPARAESSVIAVAPQPRSGTVAELHALASPSPRYAQPVNTGGGSLGTAATPVAASAQFFLGDGQSNYENVLRNHLRRYFVYPDGARAGRLSGTVELHLVVSRDGHLLSEWVQQSSGQAILDASALDLVHRAQPLPPLPSQLPDSLEISLPLEYAPPRLMLGTG